MLKITRFRVSVVSPFTNDEQWWPILEWVDDHELNAIAIFDMNDEDETGRCNYILHYGAKKAAYDGEDAKGTWKSTSIAWKVTDFGVLKTLFQALQHALGILQLPKSDARQLYCDDNTDKHFTWEEYVLHQT